MNMLEKQVTKDEANISRDETQNDEFCNFWFINFILHHEKEFRFDCNRILLES
jgi:hypothetical protein